MCKVRYMSSVHVDSISLADPRKGWFAKNLDKNPENPKKDYTQNCVSGYPIVVNTGAEAHHILPKVSFDMSLESYKKSSEIDLIQKWAWITPWNLDAKYNLYGLPKLAAFVYAYSKDKAEATATSQIIKKNKKLSDSVIKWFSAAAALSSVDPYCVHTPTTWGHDPFYNTDVAKSVKGVWKNLAEDKDIHNQTDAQKGTNADAIAAELKALDAQFLAMIIARGALGTKADWMRAGDPTWYKKFTMHKDAIPY